jgi:uncharacterized protein
MTLSMYQASVPVFVRMLGNLSEVIRKGEAHAKAKGISDEVLLNTRLIPDMLPLLKQVQIACDMATRGCARLAGVEPTSFADNEASLADVYARIQGSIDYVKTFTPQQIDGSEEREVVLKLRTGDLQMQGQGYLLHFLLPNLFFHCTTAYNILREAGTDIGKVDFIGRDPM